MDKKDYKEWVDQFIEEIETRGLAERTLKSYVTDVSEFFDSQIKSVEDIGLQEIKSYQRDLIKERNFKPNTVNRHMSAIKLFYIHVLGRYEYDHLMRRVKVPHHVPIVLSELEVARMIDCVHSVFWKAVILVTYSAGLRQGEVRNLKATDIDSERMVIHVRNGKGQRDRQAILSPITLKALRSYWRLFRMGEDILKSEWLFIPTKNSYNGKRNKKLSHTAISYIIKRSADLAGIKKKFTPTFCGTRLQPTY